MQCARATYAQALVLYPSKKGLWMRFDVARGSETHRAAQLEKRCGSKEALDSLLSEATKNCPHAWQLWLMAAKEKWLSVLCALLSLTDGRAMYRLRGAFSKMPFKRILIMRRFGLPP